jgi:hypothetical protein
VKANPAKSRWRGPIRAAIILIALFVLGAGGAMLFLRIHSRLKLASSSPMAALPGGAPAASLSNPNSQPGSPGAEAPNPEAPAANPGALAANPMSAAGGAASSMAPAVAPPPAQQPLPPTPAPENELHLPQQKPPSSNALNLPTESMFDAVRSRAATDFLKSHHLPFVTARVFSDSTGAPAFLMLAGKVATDFGKQDAARRVRDFLGRPGLALDNRIQVDPKLASTTIPVPRPGAVIQLPSVFRGCWQLVSDHQDGPVHLLPGARAGCVYTHDSGRFCYQRTPSGAYEPTFSSLRLKTGLYGRQSDEWSRVELLSTDGVDSMKMRFLLHHSDSASVIPFLFSSREGILETHELTCQVSGDLMHCEDRELGDLDGQPWCEAMHIDEFRKVAN